MVQIRIVAIIKYSSVSRSDMLQQLIGMVNSGMPECH